MALSNIVITCRGTEVKVSFNQMQEHGQHGSTMNLMYTCIYNYTLIYMYIYTVYKYHDIYVYIYVCIWTLTHILLEPINGDETCPKDPHTRSSWIGPLKNAYEEQP